LQWYFGAKGILILLTTIAKVIFFLIIHLYFVENLAAENNSCFTVHWSEIGQTHDEPVSVTCKSF